MKWQLVVDRGQHQGRVISITRSPFWIGRGPDCHLRPASPMVSRRHCALAIRDGKLFVCACETTNGTFVNGKRLGQAQELQPGDHLKVGPLVFTVSLKGSESGPVLRAWPPDEDAIGRMLLEMDDDENERTDQDLSAALRTIAESTAVPCQDTSADHDEVESKGKARSFQASSRRDTASAAGEILGKYVRRPGVGASTRHQ